LSIFTHLRGLSPAEQTADADDVRPDDAPTHDERAGGLPAAGVVDSEPDGPDPDNNSDSNAGEDATHKTPRVAADQDRRRHPVIGQVFTGLAVLLVLAALNVPDQLTSLTPAVFARQPVEGLVGAVVLLVLPARARPVIATITGVLLGLLTIVKLVDMGFYASLDRPFDPVLDRVFVTDGAEFLQTSFGRLGATGIEVGIVALAVIVLTLTTLSVLRLARVMAEYRIQTVRTAAVLGVVWVTCAALGAQLVPGAPVATSNTATLAYNDAVQANTDLHDKAAFNKAAGVDKFANTPGSQLLTGLRGKDVILAFVESYGRNAVEEPALNGPVDATLAAGTKSLQAAGFASESAYLTSPTAGGGSFLAHSTLLSGLWIDNQQRYDTLVNSNRLTLTRAFQRASWRTVAVVPDTTRAWPEGAFFGYNKIYAAHNFGYAGPSFGWAVLPDQFALADFQKTERSNPDHAPVMAEMALVSSHAPWAPIPKMINWDELGNGTVFNAIKKNQDPVGVVWKDSNRVRSNYSQSVAYTLNSLISYMEKYGNKNTVMIFLGDHQPAPIVVGDNAARQVPITIVAKDPAVLKRVSSWGWTSGLKPSPKAPVWAMDSFRDRFLTAFGPQPQASAAPTTVATATPATGTR
jgi:hypothetical protein